MKANRKKQLSVFGVFLAIYAFLAFAIYTFIPLDQLMASAPTMPSPSISSLPAWLIGLASAASVLVVYGALGLAGYWFATRLGIPRIFREGAGWRNLFLWPMLIGLGAGIVLVIGDQLFASASGGQGFAHPGFPLSIMASATAGIGEEIAFRAFVMGLWAFLFNLVRRRWHATRVALWSGNVIAALAFSAGHLPAIMFLLGVTSPAEIPTLVLVEVVLLNSFLGLIAGERYMRDGLVAAIGVHFWADIVWHVIWPLIGLQQ